MCWDKDKKKFGGVHGSIGLEERQKWKELKFWLSRFGKHAKVSCKPYFGPPVRYQSWRDGDGAGFAGGDITCIVAFSDSAAVIIVIMRVKIR